MKGGRKSCICTLPQVKARLTIPRGARHSRPPGGQALTIPTLRLVTHNLVCPGGQGGPTPAKARLQQPAGIRLTLGRPGGLTLPGPARTPSPGQAQRTSRSGQARANLKPGPSSELRVKLAPARSKLRAKPGPRPGKALSRAKLKPEIGPSSSPRPGRARAEARVGPPGQASPMAPTWNWPRYPTFGHSTLAKLSNFVLRH
jgi:hypothetical protein